MHREATFKKRQIAARAKRKARTEAAMFTIDAFMDELAQAVRKASARLPRFRPLR